MTRRLAGLLCILVCLPAGTPAAGTQSRPEVPSVSALIQAAGVVLGRFSSDAAGVVYEEDYTQRASGRGPSSRHLRSDVLIMADPEHGWIEFRDVFDVDGRPVRDRTDRLARLFAQPTNDAEDQARRIVDEGARFNLNSDNLTVNRSINLPLIALMFLRAEDQPRSTFTLDGTDTIDDARVTIVKFQEISQPRMIGSPNNAAADGRFWIDANGQVRRSVLRFTSRLGATQVNAEIRVDFKLEPKLQLWLPSRMQERYDSRTSTSAGGSIDGSATYSKFRKFDVAVEEKR